jgi:hypothetical protein
MAYLVYGIMKAPVVNGPPLSGVAGAAVSFVSAPGLAAAVSEVSAVDSAPPVAELLVYSRVVEHLHRTQAVVPMRYGAVRESLSAVQRLLAEGKLRYEALLTDLEGQVEMGIRVLLPAAVAPPQEEAPPVDGSHYLARRKAYYQGRDENARQHQALLDRYNRAFSGLYAKHRTETATREGCVVLSLYYLISRDRVDRFRETFRRLVEMAGPKTLLSGPWPPYNFVTPDPSPGVGASPEAEP